MSPLTFSAALLQAEAQARSTLPVELHERLRAAVALVKDGRVFQDSAGVWQVDSVSQEGLVYAVNGSCGCADMHYNHPPQNLCKHRLSMYLSQRVITLMQQSPVPVVLVPVDPETVPEPWPDNDAEEPAVPPPVPDPAVPLPEAPASVNCHLTIAGRQVQLTLRDTDEARLLARLQAVLAQYPMPQPPAQASSQGAGWCSKHGLQMTQSHKEGRSWWSHKTDQGWCKGGTHLRRDTVIPQWFQASKATAASDGHAVHC